jgi:hypothetical protein
VEGKGAQSLSGIVGGIEAREMIPRALKILCYLRVFSQIG